MIGIMVPRLLDQIGETESAEKSQSIRSAVIKNLSLADSINSKQPGEWNALEAVPKPLFSSIFHGTLCSGARRERTLISTCGKC